MMKQATIELRDQLLEVQRLESTRPWVRKSTRRRRLRKLRRKVSREKGRAWHKMEIKMLEKKCQQCSKIFYIVKYREKTAKFCSKICANNGKKGKLAWNRCKMERNCQWCGKSFSVIKSKLAQGKDKFCGRACYRESKKGKPSWILGKHWTKEQRIKLRESHRRGLPSLEDILASKEGTLLSEYINNRIKVTIKCKYGHEFENSPDHILNPNSAI